MSATNGNGLADRLPPHNLDAERGALGSMLLDNETVPTVLAIVKADDFYRDAHQVIFRAIHELHDAGKPVDIITLVDELIRRDQFHAIGGDETMSTILSAVPHAANAKYYAGIVREKADSRALIEASDATLRDVYSLRFTAEELQERATGRIAEIDVAGETICREGRLAVTRAADVVATAIEWLWYQRIPLGKVSMITGDPGLGKSFVTMALAACVSRGGAWPDNPRERIPAGSVILFSAEDTPEDTIRPRLEAAGADLEKVYIVNFVVERDRREAEFSLKRHVQTLTRLILELADVRLVIIDPITAYLDGADENSSAEIRTILQPLIRLARDRNIALVMINHLNKSGGVKALYRASGSVAFVAVSRLVWFICKDPENPHRRLFLWAKGNLAPEIGGLAFQIVDQALQWEREPVKTTIEEALKVDETKGKAGRPAGSLAFAMQWVKAQLQPGPAVYSQLEDEAFDAGITRATLFRACKKLETVLGTKDAVKVIQLPAHLVDEVVPDFGPLPPPPSKGWRNEKPMF